MLLPSIQTKNLSQKDSNIWWDNKKELQAGMCCKYIYFNYTYTIVCCYNVRPSKLMQIYQGEISVFRFSVKYLKNVRVLTKLWRKRLKKTK